MVLQRWNPYRELKQMEDTMDRLWRFGNLQTFRDGSEDWNILIDVMQKEDDIIVSASVPGIAGGTRCSNRGQCSDHQSGKKI